MSQLFAYHPCQTFSPLSRPKYGCARVLASARVTCQFKCTRACSIQNTHPRRRSANYQRNVYVSDFIDSLQSDYSKGSSYAERVEKLKEVVKNMLVDDTMGSVTKLQLIDDLQRLGVGYHFEEEIKRAMNLLFIRDSSIQNDDLCSTALYFRLMRQHGYKVSQDVFNCFKDETGSFRQGLRDDVKGMLSLYEACHLGFEGEDIIIHEAKDFTVKHLVKHLNENTNPSLARDVARSLELPLHWRMPRAEARFYIDAYQRDENMNLNLLELAALDFNILQATYQNELSNMSRWWKQLGLSDKLGFARDRLVESFLVSVGVAYKPQHQCCREWITKVVCLIVAVDDIYDIYGSVEELELFTAAVERWDLQATEHLPDYMIICFLALFNTINDIVYKKYKDHNLNILSHLKKVWADFCRAMLREANWSKSGYTPSLAEYLENAWVSSSTTVCLVTAFYATQQTSITNEELEINPSLIYYSSMILRLCNDLATSSAELERGDVPSAIQCYMHENNTSEQIARDKIKDLISEMWKKLNEFVCDSPFDESFVNIVVNNARTAHSIYQHGDGMGVQGHEAKERLKELLVEPITIKNYKFLISCSQGPGFESHLHQGN